MVGEKILNKRKEVFTYLNSGNNDIVKNNVHILRVVSKLAIVFAGFFFLITPIFLPGWNVSIYHFNLILVNVVFAILAEIFTRKRFYHKRIICIFIGLYILSMSFSFILLDTMPYPFAGAVFVIVFLVVAPVLFIISFETMIFFQIATVTAFIIMAHEFKTARVIGGDSFSVVYSSIVGCILYVVVMRLRLHDYQQKAMYKVSSEIDYLTQINNRATSKEKIERYLAKKQEYNACAMIVIDVDHFKEVNDKLGHEKGDEVLKEVASILKKVFLNQAIIGRFGGDEFIVFLKDTGSDEVIEQCCNEINKEMKKILSNKFTLSCSMGICILEQGRIPLEAMFHVADEALYEAKAFGRATYVKHKYQPQADNLGQRPLMVIVDDNLIDRGTLAVQFEDAFVIKEFEDAMATLAYMENNAQMITVVLLDMIMPKIDGFEVLRRMKSKPELAWIPVIAVSSDSSTEGQALEGGAVDMITKPIVPAIAKLRVANAIKQTQK